MSKKWKNKFRVSKREFGEATPKQVKPEKGYVNEACTNMMREAEETRKESKKKKLEKGLKESVKIVKKESSKSAE
jgi:hypothetical protein